MADYFDTLVNAALAEGGVQRRADGCLVQDKTFEGTPRATQATLDYLNTKARYQSVSSRVQLSWVENLDYTVKTIVAGTSSDAWALRTIMFLRLHGLVVDFSKHYRAMLHVAGDRVGSPGSILAKFQAVLAAIEAVKGALTEDEQLYAEYRRHADCHIWQSGYEPQWQKGAPAPRDGYESKFTAQLYTTSDLEERIAGVLRAYGSEAAIADDFARRIAPRMDELVRSMKTFCSPS